LDRVWAVYEGSLYDLTDYVWTQGLSGANAGTYNFIDSNLLGLFKQRTGQDITSVMQTVLNEMSPSAREDQLNCLNNYFKIGLTDFRLTPRCQVQQWMLIAASAVLMGSMALKCKSTFFILSNRLLTFPYVSLGGTSVGQEAEPRVAR
jgi:chitin synthase